MVKERDNSIDAVAGLMIIYMIFIHMGHPVELDTISTVMHYMFFYFMAWFFFKTGMFYKERSLKEEWKLCYKRLVIPLICFTVLGQMVEWVRRIIEGDYNWIHYTLSPVKELLISGYTNGNSPLWFLFTMIFARLLYAVVIKYAPPITYRDVIIAICFGTFYVLFSYIRDLFQLPIYCYNIPLSLVFVAMGHLLKRIQFKLEILFLSLITVMILGIADFSYVVFMSGSLIEGDSYVSFIVLSIAGIVIVNNVLTYLCKWYSFPILSFVGRNSMAYFVIHMPLLLICSMLNIECSTFMCFIIKYILIVAIITIIDRLLKKWKFSWVFGE